MRANSDAVRLRSTHDLIHRDRCRHIRLPCLRHQSVRGDRGGSQEQPSLPPSKRGRRRAGARGMVALPDLDPGPALPPARPITGTSHRRRRDLGDIATVRRKRERPDTGLDVERCSRSRRGRTHSPDSCTGLRGPGRQFESGQAALSAAPRWRSTLSGFTPGRLAEWQADGEIRHQR